MRSVRALIFASILVPLLVLGSVNVIVNGSSHTIPQTNERGWGNAVTAWIQAISANTFQPTAGSFALTADADFGANYGLKTSYLSTRTANPSTAGLLRLAKTDSIGWRNNANSANLLLNIDASDNLTFNGNIIPTPSAGSFADNGFYIYDNGDATKKLAFQVSGVATATTRTITVPDADVNLGALTNSNIGDSAGIEYSKLDLSGGIVNADVDGSAAISYSKLNLGSSIVNSDVSGSAAISLSKLAALGTGKALQSNSSTGAIETSSVTNTELGYLSGVTSAIQTQLGGKQTTSLTSANILVGNASNVAAAVSVTGDISLTNGGVTAYAGTVPINKGGTGQITANAAFNALAPSQTSNSGKVLTTDGSNTSWASAPAPTLTVQSKTANYTALTTDDVIFVSTNAATITMYAANTASKPLKVCKVGTNTNFVTIARAGSDVFSMASSTVTSTVLHRSGECITIVSDGSATFYLDQQERTERVKVTATCSTSPCTIASQSGAWVSSITGTNGAYTVNVPAGIFSAAPACTCSADSAGQYLYCDSNSSTSATSIVLRTSYNGSTLNASTFDVVCTGPR